MSLTNPLVTVSIATRNRSGLLRNCLKSVLSQTYSKIEVIVVDDASSDGSEDTIRAIKDKRLRYVRNKVQSGLSVSRNIAMTLARGRYFTFVDDDDEWIPEYLNTFLAYSHSLPDNYFLCAGNILKIAGRDISVVPEYSGSLKKYIQMGFTPPVSSQFYPVSMIRKVKGYSPEIKTGVDHDLWLKLASVGALLKAIPHALTVISPTNSFSRERMTTNSHKRLAEMEKSLIVWKTLLVSNFGNEFYELFCQSYRYYSRKGFFIDSLISLDPINAVHHFMNCPLKEKLTKELLVAFWQKYLNTPRPVQKLRPLFIPAISSV